MTENKDPGEATVPASGLAVLRDAMLEQAHMARFGLPEITIRHDPKQLAAMKQAHAAFAELIGAASELSLGLPALGALEAALGPANAKAVMRLRKALRGVS